MKKRTVYVIQGYSTELPDQRLTDVLTFEIYANNEEEAMKIVKNYTTKPKNLYRVDKVIETYK